MAVEVILRSEDGDTQYFDIEDGTHTLIFDLTFLRRKAVSDFVKHLIKDKYQPKGLAEVDLYNDMIGMALGYYEISVKDFYPELDVVYDLNDGVLAAYSRWKYRRELDEKNSEH